MPGPPPKRSDQRRRTNKPVVPVARTPGAALVTVPEADPGWHPVALRWYESLALSGQSVWYEPSDWATACTVAESMSREFHPQPMSVGMGKDAHIEMVELAPKAASVAAWLKAMTGLLATEGDRRRASLELQRPVEEAEADVSELAEYRRRLQSG